jgi:hypothetical protein
MKKSLAAAAALLVVGLAGTASAHDNARTIKLTEAGATAKPAIVDLGDKGPSAGDLVVVKDGLNFENGSHAGDFTQTCTLVTPGPNPFASAYECTGSAALATGTITFAGPFDPSKAEQLAAVTGGTGVYRAARGDVDVQAEADRITVHLTRN